MIIRCRLSNNIVALVLLLVHCIAHLPTIIASKYNKYGNRKPTSYPKSNSRGFYGKSLSFPTAAFTAPILDLNINIPTLLLQATSGFTTYLGLIAYFDRPRGKLLVDESCIMTKQSQVEGAGLGLYVKKSLPEGTVLGTYPGVLRPSQKYLEKYETIPQCATYTWRFTDNKSLIDPTDRDGRLEDACLGGTDDFPLSFFVHEKILGWWSVPTFLARVNEPPIGFGGCNVRTEEDLINREVVFQLSKDVVAGDELFMDYGLTYDRSNYR
mmetsp:Transcript_16190/g.19778  ORF Transcript_16190/g.19778 Transcript_16190/m.19778 type:complete len:268 (-) Transcript_16190:56-859(-)